MLGPDHLPRPATPVEAQEILAHLAELSAPLGDLEFIRRKNGEFVNEVMRVVLSAPYQFGQDGNATGQEFFWKRQIYRWPYSKAFSDFATLVAGYEPLA